MRARIPLTTAMSDPALFGTIFGRPSFWPWFTVAKLIDGIELTEERELELFRKCTGRTRPPEGPVRQLYLGVGRRGGKDRWMSSVACWRSALVTDWSRHVSAGEGAVVLTIGADRKQAAILKNYVRGLCRVPMLAAEVVRSTGDGVEFRNGGSIEVSTNDSALVRGRSAIAVLGSEVSHWNVIEHSASSDEEVFAAAAPSLAMCPDGGLLIFASSTHRKKGLMWRRFKSLWGNDDADAIVWVAPSRVMNPALPEAIVTRALADDAPRARAEYLSEWRDDISDFCTEETLRRCITPGIHERPPKRGTGYFSFIDASGGRVDSFTAAVGHMDRSRDMIVLDAVREIPPPFSPEIACAEIAAFLKAYGLISTTGDRYGGIWVSEQLGKYGIRVTASEQSKSDLYVNCLAAINSRRLELVDNARMISQFVSLERRPGRTKEFIDHPQGDSWHDDVANVVAGIASLGISAPRYDLSSWGSAASEASDPAIARSRRAREAFEAEWGRYATVPKVPADVMELYRQADARAAAAPPQNLEDALREFAKAAELAASASTSAQPQEPADAPP
jgi:hypothetical protein